MPIFHERFIELRPRDRINPPRRKEPVRKMWWVVGLAIPIALFCALVVGR